MYFICFLLHVFEKAELADGPNIAVDSVLLWPQYCSGINIAMDSILPCTVQ